MTELTASTGDGAVASVDHPLDARSDPVAASLLLAGAFASGGRLVAVATTAADHAHHIAVEFVHPVIAGLPALPAVVSFDPASSGRDVDAVLSVGGADGADLVIDSALPDAEIMAAYHLLWELVHVVLDHRSRDTSAGDSTGFLYPFLGDGDATDHTLGGALAAAAEAQRADSDRARRDALAGNRSSIRAAADLVVRAATSGGSVYVLGNGGSATDAARMTRLLGAAGVRATSLADDYAVVTALANDLGADRVFARQVDAFVRPGDVVVGWSTSGTSANVVAAFERANAIGADCIGSCGYGGDAFAALDPVDVVLAVDEQSVHRIQEAQADLMAAVVSAVASEVPSATGWSA